jgi:hypothetical protein
MKLPILCALTALLSCPLIASEQISIEAKVIEGKSRRALPHDLAQLNGMKGVDILTAPHITTPSGKRAKVEITREFRTMSIAPSKHPGVPTGVILEVTPHATRRGVAYSARLAIRDLDSVTGPGVAPVSTFTTREVYASGAPKEGEEVWLDLPAPDGKARAVRLVFRRKDA